MSNLRYAIWYEPTGKVYDEIKQIIINLAKKYHTSFSEPHITLLPGGSGLKKDVVIHKMQKLIMQKKAFTTKLKEFGYMDEYFKCIFIKVQQTAEVMKFAHDIQQEFNNQTDPTFSPHISIFYGKLPVSEKINIINSLDGKYEASFILEKVDIIEYEFGKSSESWKKVARIKII